MPLPISFSASEIAALVGGAVQGDGGTRLTGVAAVDQAGPGELTFAEKAAQFLIAEQSEAGAILAPPSFNSTRQVVIHVPNARAAFAQVLPRFFPVASFPPGFASSAVIDPSAQVHPSAHIGPHSSIGEGVQIGAGAVLMGGNHLRPGCSVGADVRLHPNVILYERTVLGDRVAIHAGTVVGSDGYGYVFDAGIHRKVLQVGNVVIESDVEIGANCALDRGALGSTVIGAGTKIDNLVHIAHNVIIGKHCLIMGQVGFAGSTQLGDYSVVASQSGIAGHLRLGRQSTVGAKSGVMRDVADGGTVLGIPATAATHTKRQWVAVQQLPEMIRRIRALEKMVEQLTHQ